MSSRIARLWQPGNPQKRVFLPDFWIKLLESPKTGHSQLPKYAATFECDLRMSDADIRQYLEKIYKLPVRDVRSRVEFGEIIWSIPDKKMRRALWKDDDRKIATVFFKKDVDASFPDLFSSKDELDEQTELMERFVEGDVNNRNAEYVNRKRNQVGRLFV